MNLFGYNNGMYSGKWFRISFITLVRRKNELHVR